MKKRWLAFLLALALVLAAASAMADGVSSAPAQNRIRIDLPEGISSKVTYSANTKTLRIALSAAQTDWDLFAQKQNAMNPSSHDVWATFRLDPVEGAHHCMYTETTGYTLDQHVYSQTMDQGNWGETTRFEKQIGGYLNHNGTVSFSPLETTAAEYLCYSVIWYDQYGRELSFDKFYVVITWDDASEQVLSGGSPLFAHPAAERVQLQFDSNLVFAKGPVYDPLTGTINGTIDTAATNWEQVMNKWYSPSEKSVQPLPFQVLSKDPAPPRVRNLGFGDGTPAFIPTYIGNNQLQDGALPQGTNMSIGRYEEKSGLFVPRPVTIGTNCGYAVQWCDESGAPLDMPFEMVRYNIGFTDYSPVKVHVNKVKVGQIVADHYKTGVPASVEEGKVAYTNSTEKPEAITLVTAVMLPQTDADASGWRADMSMLSPPYITFSTRMAYPDETGLAEPALLVEVSLPAEDCFATVSGTIRWRDENGQVQMTQFITLTFENGIPKPWPAHVSDSDFPIVPFKNLKLTLFNATEEDGVALVLDDASQAVVNWDVDADKLVDACQNGRAASAMGSVTILDAPPAGAKYYNSWMTAGGSVFGSGAVSNSYPYTNSDNPFYVGEGMNSHSPIPDEDMQGMTFPFLNGISFQLANGDTATYYTASEFSTSPYAGCVDAIFWFEDKYSTHPIGCSYIAYTFDPAELITTHPVLEDESQLDDGKNNGKKKPLIIADGKALGYGQGKLDLRAERSPSTPNTHRYELTLVNDDNAEVQLKGKGIVYVPYPDGYDETNYQDLEIMVGHYSADGSLLKEVFSIENGRLTATKHGLRFEVTSLSPFAVCWKEKEPEATATPEPTPAPVTPPPKTGDEQPLAMLLVLLAVSAAAMALLASRKRMLR